MQDAVILLSILAELLLVVAGVACGGGAQIAARRHMSEDIGRCDSHIVLKILTILDNGQREGGDVVLLQQMLRQVAGAVGSDLDVHIYFPFG